MVSCCNRRLYKGNSYEICIPITDTGVTSVSFYTSGDIVIEKEGEIVDDTMCFELTKEELDLLPDGVLRYSYEDFDSNTRYVVVTPGDYSGTTLEDIIADAFDSGYTAGQEDCSGDTCEGVFESGYTSGVTDGIAEQKAKMTELDVDNGDLEMSPGGVLEKDFYNTDGWNHVWVAVDTIDWWNSGYTSGYTDGLNACSGGNEDLIANIQGDYFIIPEGTTKIRSHAFFDSSLSSITIPSSVTAIHSYAFEGCDKLTEIVVPDTVEYIGPDKVFANCSKLTAATLPSGLTVIENNLFMNAGLTGITLPTGITRINSGGFFNCKLTGITLPTGLTFIGQSAFEYCRFTGDIVIPSGVTDIRAKAFANCSGITSMTFESPVPANIITNSEFNASLGRGSYTWPIYVPCEAVEDYKTAWPYYAHRISCQQEPEPEATAITISVPQDLEPGDTGSTSVSTSPTGATTNLSYSSSDNSVATVDNNGNITAVGTGTTNICVTDSISQITECVQLTISESEPVYSAMMLTFDIISGGSIVWTANKSSFTPTIQYSKNGGSSWTSITASTGGTSISVNAGDKVLFKGNNSAYRFDDYEYAYFYHTTAVFNLEGNIMSLVDSTGFTTATTVSEYAFYRLFWHCEGLKSAENLVLPATTLATGCYENMFSLCRGLTKAPKLPATTIAANCYMHMFSNCSSLAIAPELPATTLQHSCYSHMFSACTSLSAAPELNASTLVRNCYECMFNGCTNLNYVKCLAYGEIIADSAVNNWLGKVAQYGTFVKDPRMDVGQTTPGGTYWLRGDGGIPDYWTVEDAQS